MNQNNSIEMQSCVPKFVVDSWLLEDLVRLLASGANEEACYITGVAKSRDNGYLYRTIPVSLERNRRACKGQRKIPGGNPWWRFFSADTTFMQWRHSPSGTGEWATMQSSTISNTWGGYGQGAKSSELSFRATAMSAFSPVHKEFEIVIEGGLEYVADTVCKVSVGDKD